MKPLPPKITQKNCWEKVVGWWKTDNASRETIRQQAIVEVEDWLRQRAIRLSREKAEPLEIVVLMAAADDLASECLWQET